MRITSNDERPLDDPLDRLEEYFDLNAVELSPMLDRHIHFTTPECEKLLAQGLNYVGKLFHSDKSCNIASKSNSPFTLIRNHVDIPYKKLTDKYKYHELYIEFGNITPSKIGQIKEVIKERYRQSDIEKEYFEERELALELFDRKIRYLCRKDLPEEIYYALNAIRYLVTWIRLRKPISFNKPEYCQYCWRFTQYQSRIMGNQVNLECSARHSRKCCDEHSLSENNIKELKNTAPNWNRYLKVRKYKEEFNNELDLIEPFLTLEKSKFHKILKWVFEHNDLPPPSDQELRKLIYDLIVSRINTKKRLLILDMYLSDFSVKEIAMKTKLPKPSIYRDMKVLKRDIPAIIRRIYVDPKTARETDLRVIQLNNIIDLQKAGAIRHLDPWPFQQIYSKLPELTLKKIKNDLNINSD